MTRKSLIITVVLLAVAAAAFAAPVTINALFMKQAGYQEEDIIAGTRDFQAAHPGDQRQPYVRALRAAGGKDHHLRAGRKL